MQRLPMEILKEHFSKGDNDVIDNARVIEHKKKLALELREQLTIGTPNNSDEAALRKLSAQIRSGKVKVRLHLEHSLHAKLYLAFRDDYNSPIIGFVGSSNLTLAGISKQGELNVDVVEQDAAKKPAKIINGMCTNTDKIEYGIPRIRDKILAKHYGFTEEKLDFIPSTWLRTGINYDIKYRMGKALFGVIVHRRKKS